MAKGVNENGMRKVRELVRSGGSDNRMLSDKERGAPVGRGVASAMSTSLPAGKAGELDAKWGLNEGIVPRQTPRQRTKQDVGITSPAVLAAMKEEDAFLESVHGKLEDVKTFTDRREPAGRNRILGDSGRSTARQRAMG